MIFFFRIYSKLTQVIYYVTSWRQFDVLLSYFGIMWPIFHNAVILSYIYCLIPKLFTYNDTVWPKLSPKSKYKSVFLYFIV